ncbi:serine protease inhibitor Kazal-type 1 [Drosophila kikkawai]|uniref:Serine protease inhibitor Kazal-type 1 n=1 Tax=Drosophila kikkawai TaxID=30033 RepID=A0A6P4JDR6_DROKI
MAVPSQYSKWIKLDTMKFLSILLALCLFLALAISPIRGDLTEKTNSEDKKDFCPCPRNYEPVCGTNRITYPNRCEFDCQSRSAARQGRSLGLLRTGTC